MMQGVATPTRAWAFGILKTEEIFEVKMTKNFPKLMTDTKTVPAEAPGNREMTLPLCP